MGGENASARQCEGPRRGAGRAGGCSPRPRGRAPGAGDPRKKRVVRWVIRWVVTDHPPDHPFLPPSSGTEKVVRKGVTPFGPYIILYKGAGRGVGFCLSTRGPSIVQGPTFQTGPAAVRSPATGGSPCHVALLGGLLRHGSSSSPCRRATARLLK